MDEDTFHPASEFGQFPWDRVDSKWIDGLQSLPRGGVKHLNPSTPYFAFYREDGTADVWEIPAPLVQIIRWQYKRGWNNFRRTMGNMINGNGITPIDC